ncbi:hypothetical protein RCL_jg6030.t1 [Rhizophagus clarus]|uniref:Uncharacterized protein n=1 Tax=Rhizophagus clarus TaxID=94130 RepID=A0A8H3L2J7_9GLOM|nr:hypothetical protein RCL_jg6030.t1 [Rhizophagus clarus]
MSVITNNTKLKDINNNNEFFFNTKKPNDNFLISKLLNAIFKKQSFIPNRYRNIYFKKIRKLLLIKITAIKQHRQEGKDSYRQMSTIFCIFYKKIFLIFGFNVICTSCASNLIDLVNSNKHLYLSQCLLCRIGYDPISNLFYNKFIDDFDNKIFSRLDATIDLPLTLTDNIQYGVKNKAPKITIKVDNITAHFVNTTLRNMTANDESKYSKNRREKPMPYKRKYP